MPVRPGSLSLCGIVLILFGAMALMNLFTTELLPPNMQTMVGKTENPVATALQALPAYVALTRGLLLPKMLSGIVGVVAGIGLLKGSELARKAALAWAFLYLLLGLLETWGNVTYTRIAVAAMTMPAAVKPEMVDGVRQGLNNSTLIAAIFTLIFVLALTILLVVQLTRRESVDFCTRKPFA